MPLGVGRRGPVMVAAVFALATLGTRPAAADDLEDAKASAAQFVALARLAGASCPGLAADPKAVSAFLAHARVSEEDVGSRYKAAVESAARSFRDSAGRSRDFACAEVFRRLGEDGLGLIVESDEDPQ